MTAREQFIARLGLAIWREIREERLTDWISGSEDPGTPITQAYTCRRIAEILAGEEE